MLLCICKLLATSSSLQIMIQILETFCNDVVVSDTSSHAGRLNLLKVVGAQ